MFLKIVYVEKTSFSGKAKQTTRIVVLNLGTNLVAIFKVNSTLP